MNAGQKQLSKAEQKKIVGKIHTGGLPSNIGFPGYNLNAKPKNIKVKTIRKRG